MSGSEDTLVQLPHLSRISRTQTNPHINLVLFTRFCCDNITIMLTLLSLFTCPRVSALLCKYDLKKKRKEKLAAFYPDLKEQRKRSEMMKAFQWLNMNRFYWIAVRIKARHVHWHVDRTYMGGYLIKSPSFHQPFCLRTLQKLDVFSQKKKKRFFLLNCIETDLMKLVLRLTALHWSHYKIRKSLDYIFTYWRTNIKKMSF